jgi:murein DD-endopeptidase MepM/ murein hydrolase activator NlpD
MLNRIKRISWLNGSFSSFLSVVRNSGRTGVRQVNEPLNLAFLVLLFSAGCSISPAAVEKVVMSPSATFFSSTPTNPPDGQNSVPTLQPTQIPSSTLLPVDKVNIEVIAPDEIQIEETPYAPPSGSGIRPDQAVFYRPPEAGLESPVDWRPPPVKVPHSLHPDDHYWLVRPIPSDSRNYELEWYPYGNQPTRPEALPYRVHHGMDFPNEPGTPVFAASSGTVIYAGPLPSNRDGIVYYGNTVIIHHDWQWQGQDVYTLYAHTLELFVEVGDYVEQGQLLAGVGATGQVSGPHLHLEVRVGQNNYSSTRNPALWLAPYEGWGTLAGRFMDSRGQVIHGAMVTVIPIDVETSVEVPIRYQRTYAPDSLNGDDIWQENFAFGDLPAGDYRVVLTTAGETFRRDVTIKAGMTNFVVFQADFRWAPTYTPTPTLIPQPAPLLTPTPNP